MSIPTPFNPLGTLGQGDLPPGYIAVDFAEAKRDVSFSELSELALYNIDALTDELSLRCGISSSATGSWKSLFWIGTPGVLYGAAMMTTNRIAFNNYSSDPTLSLNIEQDTIYEVLIAPDRVTFNDSVFYRQARHIETASVKLISKGALLQHVTYYKSYDKLHPATELVACTRKQDGAEGMLDIVTGKFIQTSL